MRYGTVLFTSDRGVTPAAAAQAAEEHGFDAFYVPEHTHIPVRRQAAHPGTGSAELPDDRYMRTLDPWVALATAASVTSRIRLGTSVALPAEHDPITLAKTVASLDHLSGGRVVLGVGFGWNTDELADHGVPPKQRRTVLREYLEAMRGLWSEHAAEYHGRFVEFGPSWAWPKPVRATVPVYLGAGGTERTFDWIARVADGWISTPTDTGVEAKVDRFREVWREAGRGGEPEIVLLAGKPDPDTVARLARAGVTELVFAIPDAGQDEVREHLGRLAERLGRG